MRGKRSSLAQPCAGTAATFQRTAQGLARYFREAQQQNKLQVSRAVKAMAGWQTRQKVKGADYSRGALHAILSSAGDEFSQQVASQCRAAQGKRGSKRQLGRASAAWSLGDDGRSCISCLVASEGHWRILCNKRFAATFASKEEITRRVEEHRVAPCFYYGSTISPEDHDEFVRLLAHVLFCYGEENRGEESVVLKCIDRHGASFLGLVNLELVAFDGAYIGIRFSVLPLPRSRHLWDRHVDMAASGYSAVERPGDFVC